LNESRDEMNKMEDRETWYRVPHSAEECAVHMEAGGVVEVWRGDRWVSLEGSCVRSVDFRLYVYFRSYDYRLVYSTPVGMSPVIGAPGHAYGLAKDAPVGWPSSGHGDNTAPMNVAEAFTPYCIIEARPPAPAPEPRTEKVPLHEVIGRRLPVWPVDDGGGYRHNKSGVTFYRADGTTIAMYALSPDGLVEVLAEEEA